MLKLTRLVELFSNYEQLVILFLIVLYNFFYLSEKHVTIIFIIINY